MYRSRYPTLFYLLTFLLFITNASAECIQGDCQNGHGTYRSKNGNIYKGDFKAGKRHGEGTVDLFNGSRYVGTWKNDKFHGTGVYTWSKGRQAGDKYEGEFRNGTFDGIGTLFAASGNRYEGEWTKGKLSGYGTFTFVKDGNSKYVGQFEDGYRGGAGTYYYESGNKFEGEWRNGERHGLGLYSWCQGKSKGKKYLGYYQDGKQEGPGTYYYADGTTRNVFYRAGKAVNNSKQARLVSPPAPDAFSLSAEQRQLQAEFGEPPHFKLYLVDTEGGAVRRNETWYYPAQRTWFTFVDGKFVGSGPIEQKMPVSPDPAWHVAQLTKELSPEMAALMLLHQPEARLDLAPSTLSSEVRASMTLIFSRGLVLGFSNGKLAMASTLPDLQQTALEGRP